MTASPSDRLADLASSAQKALTPALEGAQHLAAQASEAAAPLIDQARETVAGALQQSAPQLRQAAHRAKGVQMDAKDIAAQVAKLEKQTGKRLDAQEQALSEVQARIQVLARSRSSRGGGFPWTLVLLVGAGVYVWRTPDLRSQVLGWLGQVSPEARDAVEKVGDQAQQAAQNLQGEAKPVRDAAQNVKDTAQNAGQQVGQQVGNAAQDVKNAAQNAGQDVKRGMQNASDDAKGAAQDVKNDLNRNR